MRQPPLQTRQRDEGAGGLQCAGKGAHRHYDRSPSVHGRERRPHLRLKRGTSRGKRQLCGAVRTGGQSVRHDVAGLSAVCPMESGKGGLSDDSVSTKALCPLRKGRGGQHQGHVVLCAAKHLLHAAGGAFVPAGGRHHGRYADGGANPVLCHRLHCGGAVHRNLHTA